MIVRCDDSLDLGFRRHSLVQRPQGKPEPAPRTPTPDTRTLKQQGRPGGWLIPEIEAKDEYNAKFIHGNSWQGYLSYLLQDIENSFPQDENGSYGVQKPE